MFLQGLLDCTGFEDGLQLIHAIGDLFGDLSSQQNNWHDEADGDQSYGEPSCKLRIVYMLFYPYVDRIGNDGERQGPGQGREEG